MDPDDAGAAAVAFGLGVPITGPVVVARGELGRVWKVATAQGLYALKEPLAHIVVPSSAEAAFNVEFQERMLSAGVPLPRPVRGPAGAALVGRWRAYEWAELSPFTGPFDLLGAVMARMHANAPPTDAPPDPWYIEPVIEGTWRTLLARAALAAAPWADRVGAVVADLIAANELLGLADGPRRICHLDVCPDNIGSTPEHPLMIFDWENSGPAAPRHDLGSTIADLLEVDIDPSPLVAGYRRAGGDERAFAPGDFGQALAHQAHMIELSCQRALDHPEMGDEIGDRARWRLDRALIKPLTRLAVDRLVVDLNHRAGSH